MLMYVAIMMASPFYLLSRGGEPIVPQLVLIFSRNQNLMRGAFPPFWRMDFMHRERKAYFGGEAMTVTLPESARPSLFRLAKE